MIKINRCPHCWALLQKSTNGFLTANERKMAAEESAFCGAKICVLWWFRFVFCGGLDTDLSKA